MRARRFLLLFVFCSLLPWGNTLCGQSILDREVSLRLRQTPLTDALLALSATSGVGIIFSSDVLPPDRTIDLRIRRRTLREALDRLLADTGLTYALVGQQLVLRPADRPAEPVTISGYLEDAATRERLIGATVYEPLSGRGAVTNEYGFYSLTLPPGSYRLQYGYLGYQSVQETVELRADRTRTLRLEPSILLREVVIVPSGDSLTLRDRANGLGDIPKEIIDRIPSVGGESDVVRTAQLLAGVQSGADGFGGLSVRGGGVDQNLYLLDGVPVYNALHTFGVFSVYNSDAVSSSRLLRGDFPARYGGRLSSVLDVRVREGNLRTLSGQVDVGLTSADVWVGGPLVRERAGFFVSARRSFFDVYSRPYTRNNRRNRGESGEFGYYFYDLNAKLNWRIDERHTIFLSVDNGGDLLDDERGFLVSQVDTLFAVQQDDLTDWGNTVGVLRYTYQAGPRLFLKSMAAYSRYRFNDRTSYDVERFVGDSLATSQFFLYNYASNNRDLIAKLEADYLPDPDHYIRLGLEYVRHRFQPGVIDTTNTRGVVIDLGNSFLENDPLRSTETNFFVEDEWRAADRWLLNGGLRVGLASVVQGRYLNVEPRLAVTHQIQRSLTLRAAVSRVVQPLHLLSNSGIGLPLDLWVSSTRRVPPQTAIQSSARLDYQVSAAWHLRTEAYFKDMRNLITFEEGVISSINAFNWQDRIVRGRGRAYGVELQLTKEAGRTTGWLNYAYTRSTRTYAALNGGNTFDFRFDRPHSLKLVLTHQLDMRWRAAATFQWSSGMPFTIPLQDLLLTIPGFEGQTVVQIPSVRNSLRMPANHRLDVSVTYEAGRRRNSALTFGVYNLYNRRNPIYFDVRNRVDEAGNTVRVNTQTTLLPIFPYLRLKRPF